MKNQIIPHKATHPGVLIKDELESRADLNQKELAKLLDVKPSFLNEIIKGKRNLTSDNALLLEKVFGISAEYWMRFQIQYDIDQSRIKEKNLAKNKNIEIWNIIKQYVPIDFFKKNGLLKDNLEQDINTIIEIYRVRNIDELIEKFRAR